MNMANVPQDWLAGIIVPIYKEIGDVRDPTNDRGITLLRCFGKLFISLLKMRLTEFSEDNKAIEEM